MDLLVARMSTIAQVSKYCGLVESEILFARRKSLEIFGQSEKVDQTRWRLPSCEMEWIEDREEE